MRLAPGPWVIATSNAGKIAELEALLADLDVALRSLREFGATPPPETGATFVENALLKARHAAEASGLPALADDSGLVVDALGGAPGIRSARYAGPGASGENNVAKLLEALKGVADADRTAQFHCALVLVRQHDDPVPLVAQGVWRGSITRAPVGDHGFGYDPVFYDAALGVTAAELTPAQKNAASHRARAVAKLRSLLADGP